MKAIAESQIIEKLKNGDKIVWEQVIDQVGSRLLHTAFLLLHDHYLLQLSCIMILGDYTKLRLFMNRWEV